MPIKINLTDAYWQKETKKRLTIIAGKNVDPTDPYGRLVEDNPEYILEGNSEVYIYHNSLKLAFEAKQDSKEVLYVNGEPVEVYDNKYIATLNDGRMTEDGENGAEQKDNNYIIEIKDGEVSRMKVNFRIQSLAAESKFKWFGWDPKNDPSDVNHYNQWLLTQKNVGGEINELYDPTIDPESGVRIQNIFVNQNKKIDFLFPQIH